MVSRGAVLLLPPVVDPDQEVQVNFRKDSILSGDWKPARVLARMGCRHVRVEGEREAFTPMRKYVFQVRVKHPSAEQSLTRRVAIKGPVTPAPDELWPALVPRWQLVCCQNRFGLKRPAVHI